MTRDDLLKYNPIKPKDITQYLNISLRDLYSVLNFLGLRNQKRGQYYITRDQTIAILDLFNKYGK